MIAIAYARLDDLLDPFPDGRLPGALRTVVIARPIDGHGAAGAADAHPPGRPDVIDHLTLPGRLHIFRRITSGSISLSSAKSATSLFSFAFSSSGVMRSRFLILSRSAEPPYSQFSPSLQPWEIMHSANALARAKALRSVSLAPDGTNRVAA